MIHMMEYFSIFLLPNVDYYKHLFDELKEWIKGQSNVDDLSKSFVPIKIF